MRASPFPYAEILKDLITSTMRAQRELVLPLRNGKKSEEVNDGELNKHFSWLALAYPPGTNRHLFDPAEGQFPLRTAHLLNRGRDDDTKRIVRMPGEIRKRLLERRPPDDGYDKSSEETKEASHYIQSGATRISSLIKTAFDETIGINQEKNFYLRSPLSIVYDYLTVPNVPGTLAYALLSIRNFLFEEFEIVPDLHTDSRQVFTIRDIEESLSHIWTSVRPRYLSKGEDKLPPEGKRNKVDSLIRQFLAMKRILNLRFTDIDTCLAYLDAGHVRPKRLKPLNKYPFEFSKSPYLEKLPEAGELVNELFGLPLPIRGADTIFRGGLKFSARQGLVMAIHGGPGTGKTALALALSAFVAPFEIQTFFLAEENEQDLIDRISSLVPDDIRRLNFFPDELGQYIKFRQIRLSHSTEGNLLDKLEKELGTLAEGLKKTPQPSTDFWIPKPCRAIVVLDGLHDLFASGVESTGEFSWPREQQIHRLYQIIETLKDLKALVILTTGHEWAGDATLDYLVDVAMHLSHESVAKYGAKPDRRLLLSKARHQLCASGTHGFQIAGLKGVRFSPQINYQLDRRAIWRTRLPNTSVIKTVLKRVTQYRSIEQLQSDEHQPRSAGSGIKFFDSDHSAKIFAGSHIFLNGQGSAGKAALALKIAIAPSFSDSSESGVYLNRNEKVLIVSFLYPKEYYDNILGRLSKLHKLEYGIRKDDSRPAVEVIHLYPGHLKPNDLYNRIEWELDAAELRAAPYTCVIIDGIHNVFLQFPEIQAYSLFWPQIYNSLRSRPVMMITTHTTLSVPNAADSKAPAFRDDDLRSEPLRHSLVQKTDFQFEIDPYPPPVSKETDAKNERIPTLSDMFVVKTLSAINQAIPKGSVLWNREKLVLVEDPCQSGETLGEPHQSGIR